MEGLVKEEPWDDVPFDEGLVNMIRGKSVTLPDETGREIRALCRMIDWFESKLNDADTEDALGTEGWRHYFGLED